MSSWAPCEKIPSLLMKFTQLSALVECHLKLLMAALFCHISRQNTHLFELEQLERLRSEIPPAAPWLPILVIHIRSQVKTTQSQSYKFLKITKTWNFKILQETALVTNLLKLLDKMYKYEMDPTRTVEATERTRDAGRTRGGRRTDRRTDRRSETNIPPNNFVVRWV